ncbi:MAG: iron ABC transporter permease [Myxococcales bacterium]|nr:iron ABC transporter permease [Myxococcales bacterium]
MSADASHSHDGGTAPPLSAARYSLWLSASLVAVLASLLAGLSFGESDVTLRALFSGGHVDPHLQLAMQLRLPRVLLAALVGGALALCGAALQALVRNPLADPYILGVSGGAALGGALWQAIGFSSALSWQLGPFAAFAGAGLAALLVFRLASRGERLYSLSLLLTGVMINVFCSAAIMLIKTIVRPEKAQALLMWLMGSLAFESLELRHVGIVALIVLVGSAPLLLHARQLNAMLLGDDQAQSLGVAVRRVRIVVFAASSMLVGAAVSLTGMIGFIGLVVPHIMRLLCGPDHRLLFPVSALVGATFLVLCDLAVRLIFRFLGHDFPVGVMTALIGGPLFVYLLRRHEPRVLV